MKKLIDPINTSDGLFHGKNKGTGELSTIVTSVYMNDTQSATRINQQELISILAAAEIAPDEATSNQVLAALKKLFLAIDDEHVSNALQKGNNLDDVTDTAKSRENLELDKVGNWVAVQQGGGTGMESNKVYVGWGGGKLIAQVDSTAMGELFYESNPPTASQTGALSTTGGDLTGDVTTSAEIRSTQENNFRMVNGDRGIFWRLDTSSLYLMKTASGDAYGGYDESRPLRLDLATGYIEINGAIPYSPINPQPAQDLSPYATTAWVYQNFVTGFQIGARVSVRGGDSSVVPQGAVGITSETVNDDRVNTIVYAYPMYSINGNWVNAG